MAALVLGLAGAAIGGSQAVTGVLGISATMGASIGWSIGSMLGGMIGPKTRIEGPRLQDGKVQAATHGQVIPIIYGSFRTAGNILDFSGMREHAKTETSKKAKSSVTTYSYECDVAVGICAGEIVGVRRIWANNELIYSVAENADLATIQASNKAAGNIRIYTGSEDQLPDPTLEALHGAGNVPAYRGLAYIVISRIWVEKYGNRLPNFEFEVVGKGVASKQFLELPSELYLIPAYQPSGTNIPGIAAFKEINRAFNLEISSDCRDFTLRKTGLLPSKAALGTQVFRIGLPDLSSGRWPSTFLYEKPAGPTGPRTLIYERFHFFEEPCAGIGSYIAACRDGLAVAITCYVSSIYAVPDGEQPYFALGNSGFTTTATLVGSDGKFLSLLAPLPKTDITASESLPLDFYGLSLDLGFDHFSKNLLIVRYRGLPDYEQVVAVSRVLFDKIGRISYLEGWHQIDPSAVIADDGVGAVSWFGDLRPSDYGQSLDDQVFAFGQYARVVPGGAGGAPFWRTTIKRLSAADFSVSTFAVIDSEEGSQPLQAFSIDKEGFIVAYQQNADGRWRRMQCDPTTADVSFGDWFSVSSPVVLYQFIGVNGQLYGAKGSQEIGFRNFLLSDAMTRDGIGLRDVVSDVCARVGVQPDLVDIPPDTRVGGYSISRQMSARGAIEPLQNAYFFDAVESDNGLKFVMRGADSVADIEDDDMQAGLEQAAGGDPCTIVRGQEVELPQQVSVSYADWDSDYQTSAELVQRIATPSVNRVATELPIAMSATQAARIADVWMYQAWSERTQLAFKLGPKHMLLEPTDVVTVHTAGRSYKARITSKTDDRGVIDIAAVVDGGRYTSNATGSSNFGSQTGVATLSNTLAFFINAPIVSDADNDGGFYAALLPEAVLANNIRWGGATLLAGETTGAAPTRTVASVAAPPATVAVVQRAGPLARAIGRIDQSGSILVRTNQTLLSSISRDELFNHRNMFAVVYGQNAVAVELLQFQYAEEVGEFTYELTGLLRGRFGTESGALVQIPEGAFLVQIDPRVGVLRVPGVPQTIGRALTYKAVTIGQSIEDAEPLAFASTGRGLRPYAPVHLWANRVGNDWHLRWTRRSRIDGGWRDGVDVPLGEASEGYEVTVLSGAAEPVFTSPQQSFVYTEAMQIANGGVSSNLWFSVAQVSAAVGRGEAAFWKNY